MSNTTIETLTLWDSAIKAWNERQYEETINNLIQIAQPTAKILFNMGTVYLESGNIEQAIQILTEAIAKDDHLAIGYYQLGCAFYQIRRYSESVLKFEECHTRLRGRNVIDYGQLGLRHKLYSCEALHNRGICYHKLNDIDKSYECLREAQICKTESKHKQIDVSLQQTDEADIIRLPRDCLFQPSKAFLKNIHRKDYLGKAKVIAASDRNDKFAGFVGPQIRNDISLSCPNTPVAGRKKADGKNSPKPEGKKFLGLLKISPNQRRKMSTPDLRNGHYEYLWKSQTSTPSSSAESSPKGTLEKNNKTIFGKTKTDIKEASRTLPADVRTTNYSDRPVIKVVDIDKPTDEFTSVNGLVNKFNSSRSDHHKQVTDKVVPPQVPPKRISLSAMSNEKTVMVNGMHIPPPPSRPPPKLKQFKPLPKLPGQ